MRNFSWNYFWATGDVEAYMLYRESAFTEQEDDFLEQEDDGTDLDERLIKLGE